MLSEAAGKSVGEEVDAGLLTVERVFQARGCFGDETGDFGGTSDVSTGLVDAAVLVVFVSTGDVCSEDVAVAIAGSDLSGTAACLCCCCGEAKGEEAGDPHPVV